eukprot:CAMPEP_0170564274 /NCGR_PEP_ID=MMETSP0211-20121228/71918_1 /TAXON_ID=311385 /ORGANISM="Pseudokeronopsis sp., Strain OXSARD2" /LENGTH=57 /DNA_ID=CAMNT_0010883517 /DNA_START=79 /DNA_END=252 /DNA_ORIENTATION=+
MNFFESTALFISNLPEESLAESLVEMKKGMDIQNNKLYQLELKMKKKKDFYVVEAPV